MLIEIKNSNRSSWSLGTDRTALHGASLTGWWCRCVFGQKGTAHGNRASAAQGGTRFSFGFLPFNISSLCPLLCGQARETEQITSPLCVVRARRDC